MSRIHHHLDQIHTFSQISGKYIKLFYKYKTSVLNHTRLHEHAPLASLGQTGALKSATRARCLC